jgi:3,4-dihydroxy-2-butanone 4-phosphate synthase
MSHRFSTIQNAVKAISEGRVVIVVDDEDRENRRRFRVRRPDPFYKMVNFIFAGHG